MTIARPPRHDAYVQIDAEPQGVRWKPWPGRPSDGRTVMTSLGNIYKLIRERDTGVVTYFKLKDEPPATPKEKIDAEPERRKQIRYRKGALCWFVDAGGLWFLCEVADRQPNRIVLRSHTGWDADRLAPWPHGDLLEFPCNENNRLFQRLRPLKDRYQ